MRENLLSILREPGTGAELDLKATRGSAGRIQEGELTCRASGRSYPIIAGIPRFAPRENCAGSFGLQWSRFRDLQLDSALRYRTAILDTFDMLSPQFDDPMSATEVQGVLDKVAATSFEFRTRVPINVVGVH